MLSNEVGAHGRNGSVSGGPPVEMPPFRHLSAGSVSIPNGLGPQANGVGQPQAMGAMMPAVAGRFDGPRSPPQKQNTSHVPCKFFRQGACQAGKACPFSHDLAATTDNVCKYFAKGNCKFGPKCANIHVLPNGQRVNYHKNAPMGVALSLGPRVVPDPYHAQSSALTSSLYNANLGQQPYNGQYSPYQGPSDDFVGQRQGLDISVPAIETTYTSQATSQYGSPRDKDDRLGLGLSPVPFKGLSVLDAPLPASFDSNGISHIARYGPIAASVPSKFGLESPPPSLGFARDGRTSEALKSLYSSAFGDDTRDRFNGASSPPAPSESSEYFGKRMMHSQRFMKQKIMSSSLPKSGLSTTIDRDWDNDFPFEEEFVPDNLKELLTPAEKARRGSRNAADLDLDGGRPIYSGNGTPMEVHSTSLGRFNNSPSNASPSRWEPLFQRQQREEEERAKARGAEFGHVGSPLRNSSFTSASIPTTLGAIGTPPKHSSMSMISQQLQRTRLSARAESATSVNSDNSAGTSRISSAPIGTGIPRRQEIDRMISTGSGRFTTPIDEEQELEKEGGDGEFVFSMDDEGGDHAASKRSSGTSWGLAVGSAPGVSLNRNGAGHPANGMSGGGLEGMFGVTR